MHFSPQTGTWPDDTVLSDAHDVSVYTCISLPALGSCHIVLYVMLYCVYGPVALVQKSRRGTTVPPRAHMLLNRQKEWGTYTVIHEEEDGSEEKDQGFCMRVCV